MKGIWEEVEAIHWLDETREALNQLRSWLSETDSAQKPASTFITEGSHPPTQSDVREVSNALFREMEHERAAKLLQAFGYLIEIGNQMGLFDLDLPSQPVRIHPEPSLHRATNLGELPVIERWRSALRSTTKAAPLADAQVATGALLVSATLYGGLLSSSHHKALVQRLPQPMKVIDGRAYLDLALRWRGQDDSETRRWFPDALSLCLYARLPEGVADGPEAEKAKPVSAKQLWRPIKAWFRYAKVARQDFPTNLTDFLEKASQWNALEAPMAQAAYQARGNVSHSIQERVWQRLNKAVEPAIAANIGADVVPADSELERDEDPSVDVETGPWAAKFWLAVGQASKREDLVQGALPVPTDSDPIAQLLNEWCRFMASRPSTAGNRLKASTIRRYLTSVGKRLPGLVDSDNVARLSSAELEGLYEAILDDAPSLGERRRMGAGLREFHHFLCVQHHAEPLQKASGVLGTGSMLAPVDANLISFDEYEAARQHVRGQDLELVHRDLPTVCDLMLILGFRCGLRRMEALRLRIGDHHSLGVAATRITPHSDRTLKTLSSKRTLPTQALFSDDELALLHEWQARRRSQEQENPFSQAMFGIPDRSWRYVPEETVIEPIHRALRAVTGDPRLRFHHLRHSFGSWTYLRLVLGTHSAKNVLFEHQPLTQQVLDQASDFRAALNLANRCRSDAHAVASLLGHSGPDISLLHYIHTVDLAELAVRDERKHISMTDCVPASALPRSTVFRAMAEEGDRGLVRRLWRSYPHRFQWLEGMTAGPHPNDDFVGDDEPCPLAQAISRVDRYWRLRASGVELDNLAERFGWAPDQCRGLDQARAEVEQITSKGGRSTQRHRMKEVGVNVKGGRTTIPSAPRSSLSKSVVEQLSPRLQALLNEWPEEKARLVLNYFMHNQWKESSHLIFHDPESPEMARLYLEFLSKLGFLQSDIRLISHDESPKSRYRARWRSQLNLSKRQTIARKPSHNRTRPAPRRWLFISPIWRTKGETQLDDSLSGFRYLMVMTAVVSQLPWLGNEVM